MKNIDVVIGAGYGDEGKGKITDILVGRNGKDTAVVRFNGGCQAGHTVVTDEGQRHIFGHFGAGTFRGASTIFARDFIVNPIMFWKEARVLQELVSTGSLPRCYADENCPITTPFDVFVNQQIERVRGNENHGSCGLGIGETMERHERGFPLTVGDLCDPIDLERLLRQIQHEYLPERLDELGIELDDSIHDFAFDLFLEDASNFATHVTICDDMKAMDLFNSVVFEGAQGLFLDAESEDFPYVTRSRTGLTNVSPYLTSFGDANVTVYYVSRCYLTRHGAGPLRGEEFDDRGIVDATNIDNEFQGSLRFAPLDYIRMREEVTKDLKHIDGREHTVRGFLTHCDQNVLVKESYGEIMMKFGSVIGSYDIEPVFKP